MSTNILIVGGADTGRAPMVAALLRRLLSERNLAWRVESAGVLGHDADPAQPEARDALAAWGLDISDHRARSLTDELAEMAHVLIAVDNGTARVIQAHHPQAAERTTTLGELAGRQRDIPDPFRMQIGVWISYAYEIEALLRAGLERLVALAGGPSIAEGPARTTPDLPDNRPQITDEHHPSTTDATQPQTEPVSRQPPDISGLPPADSRGAPLDRCERLLTLMSEMPDIIEWRNARRQIEAEIHAASSIPLRAGELIQPYATMLLTLISINDALLTPGQVALLRSAIARLRRPIDQQAIADLSVEMAGWARL